MRYLTILLILCILTLPCYAEVSYVVSADEKTAIKTETKTETINIDALKLEITQLQSQLDKIALKDKPDEDTLNFYNSWVQRSIDMLKSQIASKQAELDKIIKCQ